MSVGMQWENGTVIWHLFQPHIIFDVCLHISFLETGIFCMSIFLALRSMCCSPTTYGQHHHIKHSMPVLSLEMIPFTLEGRKIHLHTCYSHTLVRNINIYIIICVYLSQKFLTLVIALCVLHCMVAISLGLVLLSLLLLLLLYSLLLLFSLFL